MLIALQNCNEKKKKKYQHVWATSKIQKKRFSIISATRKIKFFFSSFNKVLSVARSVSINQISLDENDSRLMSQLDKPIPPLFDPLSSLRNFIILYKTLYLDIISSPLHSKNYSFEFHTNVDMNYLSISLSLFLSLIADIGGRLLYLATWNNDLDTSRATHVIPRKFRPDENSICTIW